MIFQITKTKALISPFLNGVNKSNPCFCCNSSDMLENSLYYYGARYYTAMENIWLSVDPLSDKYPSMSAYMYCAGNPVILVDPDGREITDYQQRKNGLIVKIGPINNEPDRLFNHDKSEHVTINDKKILPQLYYSQKKILRGNECGDILGQGYKSKSTTRNAEDAASVLDFMSRNSDFEWAVYAEKNDKYTLGTKGHPDRAPSPFDLGINSSDVKAMIHSHPISSDKDEVGRLYGDLYASSTYSFKYYTYYGVSNNLYKINKNNTYLKTPNVKVGDLVKILKQN